MNPHQRRAEPSGPRLTRGYFSRVAWLAATFPTGGIAGHHGTGPWLQTETTRPPGSREMSHQPFVWHPGPSQTKAKCPQLLSPQPYPRSALPGRDLGLTRSVRLLQPRAKRDQPAPPPARATPETDEGTLRLRRLSSIGPRPAPRESRIAECLPCVSQSENQSQTLGGRGPGEGRRGVGGGE